MQISFGGLLTLLFIGLKLAGIIDWAWIWVLAPLWISLVLSIVLITLFFAYYGTTNYKRFTSNGRKIKQSASK